MEHGASRSVKEQLQIERTIKTKVEAAAISTVHTNSKVELNSLKSEPGLVHSVKSEPALLVKEELLEDSSHNSCDQQCVNGLATLVGTGGVNEICSPSLDDLVNIKYEMADIDIGPTVLQHMDVHYTINKNMSAAAEENSIVDDCNETMPGSGVKKRSAEEKWGDIKATSQNCAHTTTEVDNNEAHVKSSLLGHHVCLEKVDFQKHLHQHCRSSSNDFKCDRTFHKPQFMSVADPSNQSGAKGIRIEQKPIACNVCEKGHSSNVGLNLHKYIGVQPFHCKICPAKFTQTGGLTMHMRVHTGEKPFECDVCHATFVQKGGLTKHKRVHTGEKPYQCDACDLKFTEKGSLSRHKRVHTGEKPYECDACHAKFADRRVLNTHMRRIHTGEKPYECDVCHAKFAEMRVLTTHMRVHTGEKPYECNACHAKFAQKGHLNQHKRIHTGEKPYECDACHAKFSQIAGLTTHMRVHTAEKPYKCDTCLAKFAQNSGLTSHMRIHTGEKPYECDACHAKFAHRGGLTTHMRLHTDEERC